MVPFLKDRLLNFPPTDQALDEPSGLLAAGGDLQPQRLIAAYSQGIFPWFNDDDLILWWTPNPRAVLIPSDVHLSTSLKKHIRKTDFKITADQAFSQVIQHCAEIPRNTADGSKSSTWITAEIINAYQRLHKMGVAHSIEVWQNQQLAGGLYGINLGRVFFGESMFSRVSNASKLAFVALAQQCERWQFPLIDCQVSNPYLLSMGASFLERKAFEAKIKPAVTAPAPNWQQNWDIRC